MYTLKLTVITACSFLACTVAPSNIDFPFNHIKSANSYTLIFLSEDVTSWDFPWKITYLIPFHNALSLLMCSLKYWHYVSLQYYLFSIVNVLSLSGSSPELSLKSISLLYYHYFLYIYPGAFFLTSIIFNSYLGSLSYCHIVLSHYPAAFVCSVIILHLYHSVFHYTVIMFHSYLHYRCVKPLSSCTYKG